MGQSTLVVFSREIPALSSPSGFGLARLRNLFVGVDCHQRQQHCHRGAELKMHERGRGRSTVPFGDVSADLPGMGIGATAAMVCSKISVRRWRSEWNNSCVSGLRRRRGCDARGIAQVVTRKCAHALLWVPTPVDGAVRSGEDTCIVLGETTQFQLNRDPAGQ